MMNQKCIFCGELLEGTTTRGEAHIECDAEYWNRIDRKVCTRCNKPMDGESGKSHVSCYGTDPVGYSGSN